MNRQDVGIDVSIGFFNDCLSFASPMPSRCRPLGRIGMYVSGGDQTTQLGVRQAHLR